MGVPWKDKNALRLTFMQRAISNEEAVWEYRKRNFIFWGPFLSFVPGILYVADPLGRLLNSETTSQLITVSWFAGIVVSALWRLSYICPHCGERFYYKWWYKNAFAMRCVHCRLRPAE